MVFQKILSDVCLVTLIYKVKNKHKCIKHLKGTLDPQSINNFIYNTPFIDML